MVLSTSPGDALQTPSTPFVEKTSVLLGNFRAAVADLAATVPGGVRKCRDLQDRFRIDVKLSWQLLRILKNHDLLDLVGHIPPAASMRKFIAGARKHNTDPLLVDNLAAAFEALEQHIAAYAGDRAAFYSMLGSTSNEVTANLISQYRRQAFEGWRYFLGVHMDTFVHTLILHPSATSGGFDYVSLRMRMGYRRLRPDVAMLLDSSKLQSPQGPDIYACGPLNPEAAAQTGTTILPAYSSFVPSMRVETTDGGLTRCYLETSDVGIPAAVNVCFGDIGRNAPLSVREKQGEVGFGSVMYNAVPTELVVDNMLVHRPTVGPLRHRVSVYADVGNLAAEPTDEKNRRLYSNDQINHLGQGVTAIQAARLSEAPQYSELLKDTFNQLGWDMREFDLYSARIEYPMPMTATVIHYSLMPDHPLAIKTLQEFHTSQGRAAK